MAILAIAGCAKFEVPVSDKKGSVDAPKIVATVDGDNTITATVTAAQGTGFYAYVAIAGKASKLDAEKVLKLGYKSDAVVVDKKPVQACVNSKDSTKANISLTGLTPNTEYTIYAVASSKAQSGVYSEVVSVTKKTTDNLVPTPLYDKCTPVGAAGIGIPFNDPITLTKNASATAYYFAANYTTNMSGYNILLPMAQIPVPADSMYVDESTGMLVINAPIEVPGAYIEFVVGAGSVVNGVGTPNEAGAPTYLYYYSATTIMPLGEACYIQVANESFDLYPSYYDEVEDCFKHMPADTVIAFSNAASLQMNFLADSIDYQIGNNLYPVGSVTVQTTNLAGRAVTYPQVMYNGFTEDEFAFVSTKLGEEPGFGDRVGVVIPEGAVQDIWGNENNALSTIFVDEETEETFLGNYLYSYNYTMDDICGTYSFTGTSYYGMPMSEEMVIAPVKEDCDSVVIYNMFANNAMFTYDPDVDIYQDMQTPLYGLFNRDNGLITVDYAAIAIAKSSRYGFYQYVFVYGDDTGTGFTLQMPQAGEIYNVTNLTMYVNGWDAFDMIPAGGASISRISESYIIPEAAPVSKNPALSAEFTPGNKSKRLK